jgi:hypothetical protein
VAHGEVGGGAVRRDRGGDCGSFAAFLWHVWHGGAYEVRTLGAMSLRLVVWIVIAAVAIKRGLRR